ncbi:hypothetical protein F5I97DRAFT_1926387 [Phlebopus sp. FC_14]|nr:hypothetical protein F5I97DRAFT_1926387 [Phlebopus sp. FC_14]
MSQNTFKSFAVLGAGTIGVPLVEELLANGASVVVMTRPSSKHRSFPAGAKHVTVDFTDIPALTAHFREHNVEVVVSAINQEHLDVQLPSAEAAKSVGVKLYVASEYGLPSEGHKESLLAAKSEFIEYLRAMRLPYLRLYVGLFMEFIPEVLALEYNGRANLTGKGDKGGSVTAISDAAGYLAYVLTHAPPGDLENRTFRIQGERMSLRDMAALYGEKVQVVHIPRFPDDLQGAWLKGYLQSQFDAGSASVTYSALTDTDVQKLDNDLWPGHRWKTAKEDLGL